MEWEKEKFTLQSSSIALAVTKRFSNNDNPNGLYFLIALGDFKGGELCFSTI
jgi:hypothetical protein